MSQFYLEQFPSFLRASKAYPKSIERFDNFLDYLNQAVIKGSVRNAEFSTAKRVASSALESAWKKEVGDHFYLDDKNTEEIIDLYYSLNIMGIHSVISCKKKIEKSKLEGPVIDSMMRVINEFFPVATELELLKTKITKGRAVSDEPAKPINPNKDVKTCPCCFRQIAVVSGSMAHHGFKRPGQGMQTSSCPGIRFRPLEISSDGLVWIIQCVKKEISDIEKNIEDKDKLTGIRKKVRGNIVDIKRGDPSWPREFMIYSAQLESELIYSNRTLERLSDRLSEWNRGHKSKHEMSDSSPGSP